MKIVIWGSGSGGVYEFVRVPHHPEWSERPKNPDSCSSWMTWDGIFVRSENFSFWAKIWKSSHPPLNNRGFRGRNGFCAPTKFLLRRGSGSKMIKFEISQIAQKLLKMKVFDKLDSRSPSQNFKKCPKRTKKFKKCEKVWKCWTIQYIRFAKLTNRFLWNLNPGS